MTPALRPRFDGVRGLVIEDQDDSRDAMRLLLESLGARVLVARDGREGFDMMAKAFPDVTLCDIRMPGMDGFTFMERVRADSRLARFKVIAVTACGERDDLFRTWSAGFDGHLVKPVPRLADRDPGASSPGAHSAGDEAAASAPVRPTLIRGAGAGPPPSHAILACLTGLRYGETGLMMVSAAEGPTRRPRILIVEDHEDTLNLYLTYLDYEGFQVQGACNGWEALAQARVFLPDVIVMDLNLPGLDGWTATQRLKADPQTRHIAVIAVSGHAMLDGQQRARESGCDLFLAKPCLPEDLARAIQRLLTRPAPARSPRKAS